MKLLHTGLPTLRTGLPKLQHPTHAQVVARPTGNTNRALRRRVLVRSGYLCECPECKAGYPLKLTWSTFEADHIVPLYLGGTNAISNYRALHVDCHARVTAEQAAARAAAGRTWTDGLE